MNKVIFDSSALLAIINQEKGYEIIEAALPYSAMSIINVTEVVSVLIRDGIPEEDVRNIIKEIIPEIIPFSHDIAFHTGTLINSTSQYDLSLSNRACIATAMSLGREIYTTDQAWEEVSLPNLQIKFIR